jgi:hypothetical protein
MLVSVIDNEEKHVHEDGTIEYRCSGQVHRDNGPALIFPDGTKKWYYFGLPHRLNGPAVIYPDGSEEWVVNGNRIPDDEIKLLKLKLIGEL